MYSKIINYTPTGTQTTRENSLAPLDVNEIVEDVHSAHEIGITLVHLHARDEELKNAWKKEIYQEIILGIRKHCPDLVICTSLTGRNFPELEKRCDVLQLKPDLASLTLSSLNFPSGASVNQPEIILGILEEMDKWGVIPELECFDSGMINYANTLIKKNKIKPPFYFNVILGNLFNAQSDLATISQIKSQIPNGSMTTIGGIGNQQIRSNVLGLLDFDGIRIGLEDNFYLTGKQKATNQQLLTRIHRIMSELQMIVMKPIELKKLGYENRLSNHR
jgi:3-keto-5-aminohexanoate cleavage enzyme